MRDGLTDLEPWRSREKRNELAAPVVYADGFGNLVSNIGRDALAQFETRFPAMRLSVRINGGAPMEIVQAYGDARKGVPLATFGSFELLEIAVRDGSAAQRFAAGPGALVTIRAVRRSFDG